MPRNSASAICQRLAWIPPTCLIPFTLHPHCHVDATLSSSDGVTRSIQQARASRSTLFGERNSITSPARESLLGTWTYELSMPAEPQGDWYATTYC
jgi:hypothetical protein